MKINLKLRMFLLYFIIAAFLILLGMAMVNAMLGASDVADAAVQSVALNTTVVIANEQEENSSNAVINAATGLTTRSIGMQGNRGKILDKNGQPMAYNVPSYNVQFIREDATKRKAEYRPMYTDILIKTIQIIEKHGGTTTSICPIRKDEQGELYLDWNTTNKETAEKRDLAWRELMGISKEANVETAYNYLRNWLFIPEDLSFEDSIKVISAWQEVQLYTGRSYLPVTIAENVSEEAIAEIESRSHELDGIQTIRTTMRVYPKGELTSHIVGYTKKMSAQDADTKEEVAEIIKSYTDRGYEVDDRIGAYGLEDTQEDFLTASTKEHRGQKVVEVSRNGRVVRTMEFQAATDGADVITTIDTGMQQMLSDSLEQAIIRVGAEAQERLYDPDRIEAYTEQLAKQGRKPEDVAIASEGSAIVMEVNTGKVIASASYPSFDNNDFIAGLTSAEYKKKYTTEGREEAGLMGTNPLLNRTISTASPLGSVFKMATGWAGLAEGVITTETTISDEGLYSVSKDPVTGEPTFEGAPRCWIGLNYAEHADQDIVKALKNSCNYYFYTVADRLKIDRLVYWTSKLGLDSPTGIELTGEKQGKIGGQKVLFDNDPTVAIETHLLPGLVQRSIEKKLRSYCDEINIKYTEEKISECSTLLLRLADSERAQDQYGEAIRKIMQEELGIPQVVSSTRRWSADIASDLMELVWNLSLTVRTGIGQASMQVTPVAVARYVSALVNGGIVYNATVLDRIIDTDGSTVYKSEPTVFATMEEDKNLEHNLAAIKEGMREVFSAEDGGSASERFADFEYKDEIGGKTGTAQGATKFELENTAWMAVFMPYENPEIVVVVTIPNGVAGSWCDSVVKDVAKYYLDQNKTVVKNDVSGINSLMD